MNKLAEAFEEEKARRQHEMEVALKDADSSTLIATLYERGVPFTQVFGQYYEMEEAGNGRLMTVEDAELLGYDGEPKVETF